MHRCASAQSTGHAHSTAHHAGSTHTAGARTRDCMIYIAPLPALCANVEAAEPRPQLRKRAHYFALTRNPSWLRLSRVVWASLALGRCRGSHLVADESPYPNLATLSRIKSACSRGGAQWRGEDNRWGMCSRGVRGRLPVRTGSCLHEQSAWGGVLEGVYPPGASTTHGSNYAHTRQRVASTFRDKVASERAIT